ncbi:MAG: orotidine-5'-phosphate decarboxylase [Actinomycetota bacterium]|nr:orotidine-5'-phosphate decarboxylase [Actinomycetota bacterium]
MKGPKLIVALDVGTAAEAVNICEGLLPEVDFFKVGLGLFCAEGPKIIKTLKDLGALIFLDLKLHDIPVQVEQATRVIGTYGVDMVTVHCLGGPAMMAAAKAGIDGGAKEANHLTPMVVGVTILTSLDAPDLEDMGVNGDVEREVGILAGLAKDAGLNGVVASARETAVIRSEYAGDFIIVTPGIRPAWAPSSGDQKRVLTPSEAVAAGSTFLVVGRPITAAPEPRAAALRVVDEMNA